jgi:hypothetical protein
MMLRYEVNLRFWVFKCRRLTSVFWFQVEDEVEEEDSADDEKEEAEKDDDKKKETKDEL